jgi:hypothetical protein
MTADDLEGMKTAAGTTHALSTAYALGIEEGKLQCEELEKRFALAIMRLSTLEDTLKATAIPTAINIAAT